MFSKKILSNLVMLFLLQSTLVAQGFTFSGPTEATVGFNQNTAAVTYYFNYYGISNLCYPGLIIAVDGNVINNDLCNNPTTPSSYTISLTPGNHVIRFSLLSINCYTLDCYNAVFHQIIEFAVNVNFKVRNQNIFSGGIIYVNDYSTPKNSPFDRTSKANDNYVIGAVDQYYNGYNWIWNSSGINNSKWQREPKNSSAIDYSSNRNTSYTVQSNDKDTKLIAALRKICNVKFQNSFVGIGNTGVIKINNVQYNSPTSDFSVIEQNPITVAAVDGQTFGNHINYYFSRWNDGNTSSTRTFYPSSHGTYTAVFVGKPSISNRNLHTGSVYNQPIVLYWNEHPNTYVTNYQIWRKVKHNGVMGNPVLIATVNRGTTTYTDYDYYLTNGYTSDLIFYDVRPYYSIEGTTSDPSWLAVYGDGSVVPKSIDSTNVKQGNTEYSIANYPNPFNPATKIAYTLKEAGNVNIKVYNLLGQQVAELVNEMQQPGSYTIEFDGSNLPSGTYIYTLITNNYTESKKMILLR